MRGAVVMPAADSPVVWMSGGRPRPARVEHVAGPQWIIGEEGMLLEVSVPPGGGPHSHVHPLRDEVFYVTDGLLRVVADDQVLEVGQGDLVLIPRGLSHSYRNVGDQPARLLFVPAASGIQE